MSVAANTIWTLVWLVLLLFFLFCPIVFDDEKRRLFLLRFQQRRWDVELPPTEEEGGATGSPTGANSSNRNGNNTSNAGGNTNNSSFRFVLSKVQEEDIRQSFVLEKLKRYSMKVSAADLIPKENDGVCCKISFYEEPPVLPQISPISTYYVVEDDPNPAHDTDHDEEAPSLRPEECDQGYYESNTLKMQEKHVSSPAFVIRKDCETTDECASTDDDKAVLFNDIFLDDLDCGQIRIPLAGVDRVEAGLGMDEYDDKKTVSEKANETNKGGPLDETKPTAKELCQIRPAENDDDTNSTDATADSVAAAALIETETARLPSYLPPRRKVPNGCAICLCSFEEGDVVSWSSNEFCNHVFHHACILDWLITSGRKQTRRNRERERMDRPSNVAGAGAAAATPRVRSDPLKLITNISMQCPCCRQDFVQPDDTGKDENSAPAKELHGVPSVTPATSNDESTSPLATVPETEVQPNEQRTTAEVIQLSIRDEEAISPSIQSLHAPAIPVMGSEENV